MKSTRALASALAALLSMALSVGCSDPQPTEASGTVSSSAPSGHAPPNSESGKPTDGIARFRTLEGKLGGLYSTQTEERLAQAGWKDIQKSPKRDDRFELRAKKGDARLLVSWRYFQNSFAQAGLLQEARFNRNQLAAAEASYLLIVEVSAGGVFDSKASEEVLSVVAP